MTFASSLTLFLALVVLALIPGPGVLAVTARTAAEGLKHGVIITAGIVAGDFVFITFALLGLSALSELMGSFFGVPRVNGGARSVQIVYVTSQEMVVDPPHSLCSKRMQTTSSGIDKESLS